MRNKIIYFFDPICGWCYGFSDHFYRFYEEHKDEYAFDVVTGGMVSAERERPIGEMADYLRDAYKRVEDMSGVKFGEKFLARVEDGSTVYGSDQPSKVFHALKMERKGDVVELAKDIQAVIYRDGIDPADLQAYFPLAEKYELTPDTLLERVRSTEVESAYSADRYTTQQFGVQGFPFAVAEIEGEYYLLARGFRPLEVLNETLDKAHEYHAKQAQP